MINTIRPNFFYFVDYGRLEQKVFRVGRKKNKKKKSTSNFFLWFTSEAKSFRVGRKKTNPKSFIKVLGVTPQKFITIGKFIMFCIIIGV